MSFEAIGYVKQLELGSLEDPAKRLLLITIAENTFNDSFRCKIEQKQLAHDCARVSDKTISRHLKKLETAKIIKRYRRHLKQGGRLPDAIEILGFEEHYNKRKAEEEKKNREREADTLSVSGTEPDSLSTGQSSDPTPRQQVSVSIRDPVLSGTEEKISPSTLRSRKRAQGARVSAIVLEEGGPHRQVVEILLAPLFDAMQRPKDVPDLAAFIRRLRDGIGAGCYSAAELAVARDRLSESRTVMPSLPQCLAACAAARTILAQEARASSAPERQNVWGAADPALAERAQELQEALGRQLGMDIRDAWFDDLTLDALEEGTLVVSTTIAFRRSWITSHFGDQLLECARLVFSNVVSVDVRVRTAARAAA